ncbi:MAG: hypothetical protein DWQ04_08820 [Chloroflexi bacterium]|nr:MAG: hypothetical protein DWQ04_08820 [Chloroflexota bacterium]
MEISFVDPLEIVLVLITLYISTSNSVQRIIRFYRIQSVLLAIITGLTVFGKWAEYPARGEQLGTLGLALLVMVLPLMLAGFIEPVLVRATVSSGGWLRVDMEVKRAARRIWRRNEKVTAAKAQELFGFIGLVILAVLVAFQLDAARGFRIGLMVSLTLHLVGLYNMVVKRDLISQVIGLLIMDHGLYLAVVKVVEIPFPAALFVLGLLFYTLITIAILVFMLPMVRRLTGSINLDEIAKESFLEG